MNATFPEARAAASSLGDLAEHDDIEPIDVETARLLHRLDPEGDPAVWHAGLLLSARRRAGASCVRLADWAGRSFPEEDGQAEEGLRLPPLPAWRTRLEESPLAASEHALRSEDAAPTPLVLTADGRLYLHRYWQAEQAVASLLRQRAEEEMGPIPEGAREAFARVFEPKGKGEPATGQAVAAACALLSPLTLVTGGPGTGKTYAAARLLALLLEARPGLKVTLAAPTGKAAKRLGASISQEAEALDLHEDVRRALPREAQTIHRLLGYRPRANRFRFHAGRPLDVDAVLIDESSMIDLLLLKALLEALPDRARLIFLGDEHQLASIGPGRVLADLAALQGTGRSPAFASGCQALGAGHVPTAEEESPLCDAVVTLKKNYRFGEASGIAVLAEAIRKGRAERAVQVLRSEEYPAVRLVAPPDDPGDVLEGTLRHARALCQADSAETALAQKERTQVLAATYHGPWGVYAINDFVEDALLREGCRRAEPFYAGRLVLVTANDYDLDLFNGDLGVCVGQPGQVYFAGADGTPRAVAPARLPSNGYESAWAVTVHKSQGSEYEDVLFALPPEMRPPLCRELIYTAVTRAREHVTIVGPERVLRRSIATPERRASGLREAVAQAEPASSASFED